ncbi:hypothetical protein Tco_0826321 [Tanacetum coccineum]
MYGYWFGGKLIQKLHQKGVYKESFSRHAAWIRGKLIQLMHNTMVPEQVKIHRIQARVQVSRLEDKKSSVALEALQMNFIFLYFILVRNINHVRNFLRALSLKWIEKVTAIEEDKDLTTLLLDDLISNLKVYEMILENDGVSSKTTTKENVKSLALKAKVTREKTCDDSDSQGGNSGVEIDLVMIGSEEAAEMVLGTKGVKAQDKGEVAIIAAKKVTLLVNVQSPRRTRLLSEDLRAIAKTTTTRKTMQHV